MHVPRKLLLAVAAMLTSLFMVSSAAAKQVVWQVSDSVYTYSPGTGFATMFVVTDEGVIVTDTANSVHAKGLSEAIKTVTDQPVRYVVLSHNHWDHAGGAQIFLDQGATVLAHVEAYEWMKGNPHPELALPNEVWAGKRKNLTLGGKTLQLHYMGMSHGMGMTVSVLPEEKVAYIADIVTPHRVMFTIVPDFNIKEWTRALNEVEQMDFTKAVFSHSHAEEPFGSMKDVVLQREYIADLTAAIVTEFQQGTPFEQVPGKIKLDKYKHWAGYDDWLQMNALRVMLDMWMGPYPWRPTPHYE